MERLEIQLSQMKAIARAVAAKELIVETEELQQKLQRERLYVVILGLFKRGKSSLINALLGEELLPVAVTPLTAIITLLEFTEDESFAEVEFMNGHTERREPRDIQLYVSEEENPDNRKQVRVVRVYHSAPLLRLISLVDTPGLGSAFEHNTATTLQFVPKIDAALFILSADMPVSKPEIDFLSDLKGSVSRILFVMNKIDLLNDTDLKKMISHNISILSKLLNKPLSETDLMLVSARKSHAGWRNSGVFELRRFIEDIAINEKDSLLEQSAIKQYRWLHSRLQILLQLKLDTLTMPLQELERKQEELNNSVRLMQHQRDEFESIINGKIHLLQDQIHVLVSNESKQVKSAVYQKLDDGSVDILNIQMLKQVQSELNESILSHFNSVKSSLEEATREQFRDLLLQYSNRSQSFLNELAGQLKTLMGVSFDMIAGQFDLNIYTSFYLSLDSGTVVISPDHSIWNRFIPASVRRKTLLRRLREHYDTIIIRNSAAIGYDLEYKIQESFRKFNYDLNNQLASLLKNIESIIRGTIQSKNKKIGLLSDEIDNLKKDLAVLNSIMMP